MKCTRERVYLAVDSERDYQDDKWQHVPHSPLEFTVYMEHYCRRIFDGCAKSNEYDALTQIRKIAALAVACMEEHGAPQRTKVIS